MIYGVVNSRCEATLPLVVSNNRKQQQVVDTVIDTGFSEFLTLPFTIIAALGLPWSASNVVTLGDGSETLFDIYTARVIWDGQYREIYVAASETEPLLGMALLHGYRLQIDAMAGGSVKIEPLRGL